MEKDSKQKAIQPNSLKQKQYAMASNEKNKIYFERQDMNLLCGMHSLNNFLGQPKYTVESLNEICYLLADGKNLFNPHRHWMIDGDFDVNVLMYALQQQGFETRWHDKRKQLTVEDLKEIQGFLVNVEVKTDCLFNWSFLCCGSGRHWLTVKKLAFTDQVKKQQKYVLLDSSSEDYFIMSASELVDYLLKVQKQNGQIILIQKRNSQHSIKQSKLSKKSS